MLLPFVDGCHPGRRESRRESEVRGVDGDRDSVVYGRTGWVTPSCKSGVTDKRLGVYFHFFYLKRKKYPIDIRVAKRKEIRSPVVFLKTTGVCLDNGTDKN